MAIVVVGGSGRGVGKTALICGLIAALPEFSWTAVKITRHKHGLPEPIWEGTRAGQGSDTGRYLAAGAARAFLVTAYRRDLPRTINALWSMLGPGANILFESNSVLEAVEPDLCLAVRGERDGTESKPSFSLAVRHADAMVARAGADLMPPGMVAPKGMAAPKPVFQLADLGQISPEMLAWLRPRLRQAPSS